MSAMDLLDLRNPVFRGFLFYAACSIGKMMLMSWFTIRHRVTKEIFANPEDSSMFGGKVDLADGDVERVRRNHRNDLENIIPFVFVGLFYVLINPDVSSALWHFRIFFFSRVIHTFVYLWPVAQPSRVLAFMVGQLITFSMLYTVIVATF